MNEIRNQGALTIFAKIKSGETQNLRDLLAQMVPPAADVENNDIVPFVKLTTIHFARFVVVDKSLSVKDELRSLEEPFLLLSTNYDNPLDKHLEQLVDVAGDGLDQIYGHCEGYPDQATDESRLAYLRNHMTGYGAFHNGTVGLSVDRIINEGYLRDEIEDFIDKKGINRDWSSQNPQSIREGIRSYISGQTDFKWALTPPGKPPLSYYLLRGTGWRTLLQLLISLPFIIVFFPILAIILRYKERTDKIFPRTRYDDHAKKLAAREDKVVQNQMTLLVDMKPGLFRLLTLKFVFTAIEVFARYLQTKGELGGIPTIHFARWVFALKNRGLLFLSNYGSSWESYLGDFIDRQSYGLTAVWSNSVLYPRTRWLITAGAQDEERFKAWTRAQQTPTDVWYTAYKTLTVKNIINNKEIRKGLSGNLTKEQTLEWLRRL